MTDKEKNARYDVEMLEVKLTDDEGLAAIVGEKRNKYDPAFVDMACAELARQRGESG